MDCNIGLFLYQPVDIVNIRLTQGGFTPAQRNPGFHRAGFPHPFFQTINRAGIYEKAFCHFLCIMGFVPGFNK